MKAVPFLPGPILGYHGCDKVTANAVLSGVAHLSASTNAYDWLGEGIYFWANSPARALDWARSKVDRGVASDAAVVGAIIQLGHCLNLTDYGIVDEVRGAYAHYAGICHAAGIPLPINSAIQHGVSMNRRLDCAVIGAMHALRDDIGASPYDTVHGVFEEDEPLFAGAAMKSKTHIQIAVRNPDSILGYFRVPGIS